MEYTCQQCGNTFIRHRKHAYKYCSVACHNKAFSLCRVGISESLDVREKRGDARRATSLLGHKVDIVCDGCGVIFKEYLSKRPKPLKFCTRKCGFDYRKRQMTQFDVDQQPVALSMLVVVDFTAKEIRNK